MKKETLEEWFKKQEDCWELAEPESGHRKRFSEKLGQKSVEKRVINLRKYWKPLAVAASVLLIAAVSLSRKQNTSKDLANVSPKMERAQDFFTSAIASELYEINAQRGPATKKLIDDALLKLGQLEDGYEKLKVDLVKSGEDKRVIHAMITNFQTRIDLLEDVMAQIEKTKKLKDKNNENNLL